MDDTTVKIIAEHEFKVNQKLVKEFESLKPKPYRGVISFVFFAIFMFLYQYFTELPFFEDKTWFFFMAVMLSSGAVEAESLRINKRIDTLVKLIKSGSIKPENS